MEHEPQELAWITRAKAGDREAFDCIVRKYQTAVYNLAYRMTGNQMEAEDAAQESFVRAYTRLNTYDTERKFSSWLLSIVSHYCIDQLRRRKYTWLPLDELPPGDHPAAEVSQQPEAVALRREKEAELQQLLGELSPDYRAVVVLYYWYDLPCREIAEVTNTTENAVKSRLFRARQTMAEAVLAKNKEASRANPGLLEAIG